MTYHNFCSACAVTVVIFGHESFFFHTYLLSQFSVSSYIY